jgi:Na+-translocating ferredoxin:NAD+ oxidoreductase RNF subunit RnfB
MKTIRDPDQGRLFDPFEGIISPVGWKQIEQGWQGLLRHIVLKRLPAARLGDDLSEDNGRPSKELYAMCGLLLIREFQNWTVPQTHEAILFRSDVQYALNLEPGFEISQRTIERYIARLQDDTSLASDMFVMVTDHLVSELELSVKKQRLDSTHVLSDMAIFGRARMMGVAIKRLLTAVHKRLPEALEQVPITIRERYLTASDAGVFGYARTSEQRQQARIDAAQDMWQMVNLFGGHEVISQWKQYQLLSTMFHQQCDVVEDKVQLKIKAGGHVLQNTSDPDATFCGHKGPGYQVQISETCDDDNEVNLIISAHVETAADSDAQAVEKVLADEDARNCLPEELLADAGYGGDKNYQRAMAEGVDLTSPVPGGAKYDAEKIGFDQFEISETESGPKVTACPAGHAPLESAYDATSDHMSATMDAATCSGCPLLELCPVRLILRKKGLTAKVYFEMREHRAAARRAAEQTDAFRKAYRKRSGIEGTNSSLKRRMGLGHLRVRGSPAVSSAIMLKLTGWNLLRASTTRHFRALIAARMAQLRKWGGLGGFAPRFCSFNCQIRRPNHLPTSATAPQLALAA